MRLVLVFLVALTTSASAASYRWTSAFAQGTTEAIIRNEHGASVNIYCPSGQVDTAPGMLIDVKTVSPKAGEKVAVQFAVDGKSYAFDMDEIHFIAKSDAQKAALSALIDAIVSGKSKSFAVEFPKLGVTERFSLLGAKKAMTSATEFLDGCTKS
jgi:hypothetical protein